MAFFRKSPAATATLILDTPEAPSMLDVEMPDTSHGSDATYYQGIFAQLVRMWRCLIASVVLNCLLVALNLLQTARYVPAIQMVDASTQKPYVVLRGSEVAVGDESYDPIQVRSAATNFLTRRFAYNPLTLQEDLQASLTYMTTSSAQAEQAVIEAVDWNTTIVQPLARYTLAFSPDTWTITPRAAGLFDVTVTAEVSVRNATSYKDRPFEKTVVFTLVVQRGVTTKNNPLGYYIIQSPKDIL